MGAADQVRGQLQDGHAPLALRSAILQSGRWLVDAPRRTDQFAAGERLERGLHDRERRVVPGQNGLRAQFEEVRVLRRGVRRHYLHPDPSEAPRDLQDSDFVSGSR